MENKSFEAAIDEFLGIISRNLNNKAVEYATDIDRLHNFNRGAEIEGKAREAVIWGIALKHLISVKDMIDDIEYKGKIPSKHFLDEKLGDWGTYMALLYASITDKITDAEMQNFISGNVEK